MKFSTNQYMYIFDHTYLIKKNVEHNKMTTTVKFIVIVFFVLFSVFSHYDHKQKFIIDVIIYSDSA